MFKSNTLWTLGYYGPDASAWWRENVSKLPELEGDLTLHKFMVALDDRVFVELSRLAATRNITVQELLRAVVVPDWIRQDNGRLGFGGNPRQES